MKGAAIFGIDDHIASFSDGSSLWLIAVAAVLLGLRHATDPDHLAAVTTLVAGTKERAARGAAELGLAWGAGHAVTLFAFGLPVLLLDEYLPARVQQVAETAIAVVIVYLAVRLLARWRRGSFHVHSHRHAGVAHAHGHRGRRRHDHPHRARTPLGAFAIGLVHGMGGSAGIGVLIVASVHSTALATVALALLAVFTAVSMTVLSTGLGLTLKSRPVQTAFRGVAPALGAASLAFGVWYGTAAWALVPYPL